MADEKKKPRLKKGNGTILVLTGLFLASAGLRVATGADAVFAQSADGDEPVMDAKADEVKPAPSFGEMDAMLRAFEEREARIEAQELQIAKRLKALNVADQKITERLAELQAAEENLRATLALSSTAAEDDLARLTSVYENMKPKTAAALFEEMAPEFAAGFLGRMRPDAAAAVMAGMTPEKAYSVSAILAGRNANVPDK